MNLAEMLAYTDIEHLSRIADHYNCECSTNSKHELIQSILTAIHRQDTFEQSIRTLRLEELRFLNTLLFDQRDAFSLEELLAWARKTKFDASGPHMPTVPMVMEPLGIEAVQIEQVKQAKASRKGKKQPVPAPTASEEWSPRETIKHFKQRGWLFNGHSQQTKYLFKVPRDLKRRISEGMSRQFQAQIQTCEAPEMYREEHDLFLDDILAFLRYVHEEAVILTTEGYIYKRQLHQIVSLLQIEEALVTGETWRFGYGRKFKEYPSRFSLLYDYCFYQQYMEEDGEKLSLSERGRQVLARNKKDNPVDLYRFWIRLYKGAIHNLQPLVHWIHQLCTKWVTIDSLKNTLCPFIKPYYYDDSATILEVRILQMMHHLGLIRIGTSSKWGTVIQMTPLGIQVISGTYVADNDRIVLPEEE